ncbi:MAG: hypothetical protein KDA93_11125 [Planctomycetaceae bacterium]|nr:hypothetical protein [Planctomycetaceae bacterium]
MEYHVKPIGKACAATGEPLEPGSVVYSVLVDLEGETIRLDYQPSAWEGPPPGMIGQWRAIVPLPEEDKPKPLDAHTLLEHFQKLLEDANPAQEKLCYVLALLLLQKRRLTLDGTRVDGDFAYLELSGSRGEGPFEVRDQQLTADEVTSLQSHLMAEIKTAA